MSYIPSSKFLLIDCNQFFVSCEQLFNPKLLNKPVVVLSSNDGCVIARSKEAKTLGIPMGAPAYQWQAVFDKEKVFTLSSNFALYADLSNRVMDVLHSFTDEVEEYSIDEAFLKIPAQDPVDQAIRIKKKVQRWTGIPVSIGIGPTKTLAKVASDIAKSSTNGVFDLISDIKEVLKKLDIQEVWGIGRRVSDALKKVHIRTAFDLYSADDSFLKKRFGITLLRIAFELRGLSCLTLEEVAPSKKSITTSRSFGRPVEQLEELEEALASYTAKAATQLREQKLVASSITCFLATSRFLDKAYSNSASFNLPLTSSYTPYLLEYAKRALHQIYRQHLQYKKVGVILTGLVPETEKQMDLMCSSFDEKHKKAMEVMDQLKASFGKASIRFAAEGMTQPWRMKQNLTSSHFTTRWEEILEIKI